jgi:hypothetical protein
MRAHTRAEIQVAPPVFHDALRAPGEPERSKESPEFRHQRKKGIVLGASDLIRRAYCIKAGPGDRIAHPSLLDDVGD